MNDSVYIKHCFTLARRASKATLPNPQVGAVLVYQDKVIGVGYHHTYGSPHAEVNCLASVKANDRHLIDNSTLYVSLEPCCHFGKTPPCTDLIIKHKIPKVVISTLDPTAKVNGKGVQKLQNHGIEVKHGILHKDGINLIRPFIVNAVQKRPFILLKIVKSKDHFIGKQGQKVWITSKTTDIYTHKLRSKYHGILVGSNTVLIDSPMLTTRHYPGKNPVPILIDRRQRIPLDHPIFNNHNQLIYFTYGDRKFKQKNISYFDLSNQSHELAFVMTTLYNLNIYSVIIEGGKLIMQSFIKANLWDKAVVIEGEDLLIEGIKAPNIHGKLIKRLSIDNDRIIHLINKNQ